MSKQISIGIVEDHTLFRKSFASFLSNELNYQMLFDFENGKDLMDYLQTRNKQPDILLLDIEMPVMNGEQTLVSVQSSFPKINVIMLSNYFDTMTVSKFVKLGAKAFMPKNIDIQEIFFTINTVYEKGIYYSDFVSKSLSNNFKNEPTSEKLIDERINSISERELEVLKLLMLNLSNDEIADKLFISKRTVESHRNTLLKKTNSKNILALIQFANQNGIIH